MQKYDELKDKYDTASEELSYKRFLGLMPEEDVIDPSLLTKFRRQRLKDVNLLDMLIGKTVGVALEKGIIKTKTIIVDATHTISRANALAPIDVLKMRCMPFPTSSSMQGFRLSKGSLRSKRTNAKKHWKNSNKRLPRALPSAKIRGLSAFVSPSRYTSVWGICIAIWASATKRVST